MMPLIENGVAVYFPDANYFQLSDCDAYKVLTPDAVKEMDICWLDKTSDTLWMVELKAFHHPENPRFWPQDISNDEIFEYWLNELFIKSVHTLCMIETYRSGTKQCLVEGIKSTTMYKLVHLINVAPAKKNI